MNIEKIKELENQIGERGHTVINSENRGLGRKWLTACGVEHSSNYANSIVSGAYNDTTNVSLRDIGGSYPEMPDTPTPTPDDTPDVFWQSGDRHLRQARWQEAFRNDDMRILLGVTRQNKEDAKSLGALWNPTEKVWFADMRHESADALVAAYWVAAEDTPDDKPAPTPAPKAPTDDKPDAGKVIADAVANALAGLDIGGGQSDMDEPRIIELIKEHSLAARPLEITVTVPDGERREELGPQHAKFDLVLLSVSTRDRNGRPGNAMLVGPAGSGKTTAGENIAQALGVSFYMTGAVDTPYALSGFLDAQGNYNRTAFREAFEHGGLFLFDEIDGSHPAALLFVNAALAGDWQSFPDGMVKRHADFYCVAAANTYGRGADRQYVGRNPMDAASIDRFDVFDWDYDDALEDSFIADKVWLGYVRRVRAAIDKQGVRHVVSPRASLRGEALLAAGMPRADVENSVIWKGLDADTRNKIEAAI